MYFKQIDGIHKMKIFQKKQISTSIEGTNYRFKVPDNMALNMLVNLVRKEKPVILSDYIPVMRLTESFSRHSNVGQPLFIRTINEDEKPYHRYRALVIMEAIFRLKEKSENIAKTVDEYKEGMRFFDPNMPDPSKLTTEETKAFQDTSLAYFHKDTLNWLLTLDIIKILQDYTMFFIAEINPSIKDTINNLHAVPSDVFLEEIIKKIADEKGMKLTQNLTSDMAKLSGYIFVFGKIGCIWKY